ncbi:transglutaminase domain-containing protein [Saccharolobus islandicus]
MDFIISDGGKVFLFSFLFATTMTRYKLSAEVSFSRPSEVKGKLYMIPYKDHGQKVLYFDIDYPSFCKVSVNQDRFRNEYLSFDCNPSGYFSISINYEVEIYSFSKFENEENVFLSSSKYVNIDKFRRFNIPYSSLDDLLNKVTSFVRGSIKYDKNNSRVKSAFGSLIMGSGVCVNYSHVTIGILRALGIPARYVVGLIPYSTKEAHAWVEVKVNDVWFPVDPTNATKGIQYLKWAIGRDDADVRSKIWYRKPTSFDFSFNWYFR